MREHVREPEPHQVVVRAAATPTLAGLTEDGVHAVDQLRSCRTCKCRETTPRSRPDSLTSTLPRRPPASAVGLAAARSSRQRHAVYSFVLARPTLRSNRNLVFQCAYHVVWCTKYRRPVLREAIQERLRQVIAEAIQDSGAWLVELESMPDHVHLLVEVDPQLGIHRLVKAVKGRSSRLLRQEFPELSRRLPTLWTNSYFVATTGGAPRSAIKRYVQGQKGR
jgi:putative transposase